MKNHSINYQNDFIRGYYQDSSVIEEILAWFEKSDKDIGQNGHNNSDPNVKNSLDIKLQDNPPLYHRYFEEILDKSLEMYLNEFEWANKVWWFSVQETTNVQGYYPPNGGYPGWHAERTCPVTANRHLVFMTYLNDVTDAGETEFYYQNIKVKPERGLTLIWPSDWTHVHRGNISPTQEKTIVTGWLSYEEFDESRVEKYTY
jgi:hypothetical protein